MRFAYNNIEQYFEVGITNEVGDFATGLTVTYEIRQCSDNSLVQSGTTTESSGVYSFTYTFTTNQDYRVKYITPTYYDNGFETVVVMDLYSTSGTTAADIWGYSARTLTSGGATPTEVWGYSARTLTESISGGTSAAEVWAYKVDNTKMSDYVQRIDTNTKDIQSYMVKIEKYIRSIREWILTKFNTRI